MRVLVMEANNVRNAVSAARRHLGINPRTADRPLVSGGEDHLWRVSLDADNVLELVTRPGTKAVVLGEY
jgi:hypothetical protein